MPRDTDLFDQDHQGPLSRQRMGEKTNKPDTETLGNDGCTQAKFLRELCLSWNHACKSWVIKQTQQTLSTASWGYNKMFQEDNCVMSKKVCQTAFTPLQVVQGLYLLGCYWKIYWNPILNTSAAVGVVSTEVKWETQASVSSWKYWSSDPLSLARNIQLNNSWIRKCINILRKQ